MLGIRLIIKLLKLLGSNFLHDLGANKTHIALLRFLRGTRAFFNSNTAEKIIDNPLARLHIDTVAPHDNFFFLAHRHYLATNLQPAQRIQAAYHHYEFFLQHLGSAKSTLIFSQQGLLVWEKKYDDNHYEIKLMAGNDVLYEGGCSVVIFLNKVRLGVVSFSVLPREIVYGVGTNANQKEIIFVTRKHVTADHSYQKAFNQFFDRTTPAHLCFGVIIGLAKMWNHTYAIGIASSFHPSLKQEYAAIFNKVYDEFWRSLQGSLQTRLGCQFALPLQLSPLESMDAKTRKRAIARRAHMEEVAESTVAVLEGLNDSINTRQ